MLATLDDAHFALLSWKRLDGHQQKQRQPAVSVLESGEIHYSGTGLHTY